MGQLHKKEPTGKNANTKESPVGWAFQKQEQLSFIFPSNKLHHGFRNRCSYSDNRRAAGRKLIYLICTGFGSRTKIFNRSTHFTVISILQHSFDMKLQRPQHKCRLKPTRPVKKSSSLTRKVKSYIRFIIRNRLFCIAIQFRD